MKLSPDTRLFLREFGEAFVLFAFAIVVGALFILLDN